jgi:hypothetical protein
MDYDTNSNSAKPKAPTTKAYITLDSLLDLINNYIIIGAGTDKKLLPFTKLSTYSNTYETDTPEPLSCLSHPLQVSVDPDVCIITNNLFAKGFDIKIQQADLGADNGAPTAYNSSATEIYKIIRSNITANEANKVPEIAIVRSILSAISITNNSDRNNAEQNAKAYLLSYLKVSNNSDLGSLKEAFDKIAGEGNDEEYKSAVKIVSNTLLDPSNVKNVIADSIEKDKEAKALANGESKIVNKVNYLATMDATSDTYVKKYQSDKEFGIIGNIYINLDRLIQLATDSNTTISDKKEIKLYDFIKNILREIQESTGNINNFDIHIDPIDSIARIIDINYIDKTDRITAYNKAFQLEVANTSGVVRSYTLQSQIFPEQSSMIAIGAQVKAGGEQGADNSTLLDFNKGIQDRIIPVKLDPKNSITTASESDKMLNIIENIKILQDYFFPPKIDANKKQEGTNIDLSRKYKNSLRDTIKYIQGITDANSKNRSIIPIKVSLTIDGIGGLIIGHLFKFPDELLPQGYKFTSKDKGVRLLQTIIGLGHKIDSNGWTTTLDAYNMVLNNPEGITWNKLISKNPSTGNTTLNIPTASGIAQASKDNTATAVKFFLNKGYKDYQVAAIIGALLQESEMNPTAVNIDSTGKTQGTLGIAQWRGPRQAALRQKPGFDTLEVQLNYILEEFAGVEILAGRALSNAGTFNDAVVAMAKYERFYGKGYNVTFENLSRDYSRRVSLSQSVLNSIKDKKFTQAPIMTNPYSFLKPNATTFKIKG